MLLCCMHLHVSWTERWEKPYRKVHDTHMQKLDRSQSWNLRHLGGTGMLPSRCLWELYPILPCEYRLPGAWVSMPPGGSSPSVVLAVLLPFLLDTLHFTFRSLLVHQAIALWHRTACLTIMSLHASLFGALFVCSRSCIVGPRSCAGSPSWSVPFGVSCCCLRCYTCSPYCVSF